MTPSFIVKKAKEKGNDLIAITDHNSTRQCEEVVRMAKWRALRFCAGPK
jgi:predicted metal-dependent phosphoesterase TrpH